MTLFINGRHAQGFGLPKNNLKANGNYHPLESMPLFCSSLRSTRLIQAARVGSPSSLACSSNCALNSSVRRIWYCGDRFSFGVDTVLTLKHNGRHGNYHCTCKGRQETTRLGSAGTLTEPLTTNVKRITNMAINKFTFLLAQGKQYIAELHEIRLVTVLAATEQEARALAGAYPLVFVGRCPVQGVAV